MKSLKFGERFCSINFMIELIGAHYPINQKEKY